MTYTGQPPSVVFTSFKLWFVGVLREEDSLMLAVVSATRRQDAVDLALDHSGVIAEPGDTIICEELEPGNSRKVLVCSTFVDDGDDARDEAA